MGIEKNPLGKPCAGCWFLGRNLGNCDYWLIMDKLRPCPGGKDCTVKRKDPPPGYEDMVKWDTAFAKRLYDRGASDVEIARAVGANISEVKCYRKRNWGVANHKDGEKLGGLKASWDTAKGLELYRKGLTDTEIAEACGVTTNMVNSYRRHHWGKRNEGAKRGRPPVKEWDKEKGYALYCQGLKDAQIARELGTTDLAVANYRRRHWRGER